MKTQKQSTFSKFQMTTLTASQLAKIAGGQKVVDVRGMGKK